MPFITIDVTPDPHGSRHFEVVIKRGNEVLVRWDVGTEEQGRKEILGEVENLNKKFNPDIV